MQGSEGGIPNHFIFFLMFVGAHVALFSEISQETGCQVPG